MTELSEGRILHYVAYNGRHLAAIMTGIELQDEPGIVDLVVFTNMENVNGVKSGGIQFHFSVPHSSSIKPGTWHWPLHEGGHE